MPITKVKETCLYFNNLEETREFYHKTLSFPIIAEVTGRHVFFRVGSSVLLCFDPKVTAVDNRLPPHFANGNQHVAFEVPKNEYQEWKEQILNKGIEIIHTQKWQKGIESFYFKDNEHNILEIVPEGMWD